MGISERRSDANTVAALCRSLKLISSGFSLVQVLEALLDIAIDLSGAGRGFIVLEEDGRLLSMAARNYARATLEDHDWQFSRSIVRQAVEKGEPILTTNASADPRFAEYRSVHALGLRSIMCLPMSVEGALRGALYLDNLLKDGHFANEDLELLSALASQAAAVVSTSRAMEQQRRIRDLLDRYVSPQVAEELLARPDLGLVARRQPATVLFSDIRGFSAWAEQADPEDLLRSLNGYYELLVEIMFANRGTLVTYMGDGVMVAFGAPVPDERHAQNAVTAARQLLKAAEQFQFEGNRLRIGVGMNSGDSVVGDVGSLRRREFAVIGNTTNVAARVEKLTGRLGHPVLYTESTYQSSGEMGHFVGEHPLRGLGQAARLYSL